MAGRGNDISRRSLLTRPVGSPDTAADQHCISSAVVVVLPGREEEVTERLRAIQGVEVHGRGHNRLVLVLEGPSTGAVGGLLATISVMDGVIAANMVFEHAEPTDTRGA